MQQQDTGQNEKCSHKQRGANWPKLGDKQHSPTSSQETKNWIQKCHAHGEKKVVPL